MGASSSPEEAGGVSPVRCHAEGNRYKIPQVPVRSGN